MDDQEAARQQGIERAAAASADWRSFAKLALRDVAVAQEDLTSDDVWRVLHQHKIPDPTEPRAMGPVMLAGVADEWIVTTGRIRISDNPASPNHKRPQRIYRSMICGGIPSEWKIDHKVSPLRSGASPTPPPLKPERIVFGIHTICPICKATAKKPPCWNCQGTGYVGSPG